MTCDTSVYVRVRWGKSPVLAWVVRIGPAVDSRIAVEEIWHPLDRQPPEKPCGAKGVCRSLDPGYATLYTTDGMLDDHGMFAS